MLATEWLVAHSANTARALGSSIFASAAIAMRALGSNVCSAIFRNLAMATGSRPTAQSANAFSPLEAPPLTSTASRSTGTIAGEPIFASNCAARRL